MVMGNPDNTGDWGGMPEFYDKPVKVEKIELPLTPQERLARAAANLKIQDELVTKHNAETSQNGPLDKLLDATREKRMAEEALGE